MAQWYSPRNATFTLGMLGSMKRPVFNPHYGAAEGQLVWTRAPEPGDGRWSWRLPNIESAVLPWHEIATSKEQAALNQGATRPRNAAFFLGTRVRNRISCGKHETFA